MTTFLDTNVAIALINPSEKFHAWSVNQLQISKANGPVLISDIVYAEWSVGMKSQQDIDTVISNFGLERYRCSDAALFRAGKAFLIYRKQNAGQKTGVLPDFFIGAIAEITGQPLITANPKDFSGYFTINIIQP